MATDTSAISTNSLPIHHACVRANTALSVNGALDRRRTIRNRCPVEGFVLVENFAAFAEPGRSHVNLDHADVRSVPVYAVGIEPLLKTERHDLPRNLLQPRNTECLRRHLVHYVHLVHPVAFAELDESARLKVSEN